MKSHEQKLKEGAERNTYWQSLTPATQLADLDRRLGKGIGAKRVLRPHDDDDAIIEASVYEIEEP